MDEFTTQEAAVLRGLARHMLEMLATAEKRAEVKGYNAGYVDGCFTKSVKDKFDAEVFVGRKLAITSCVHGVLLTTQCVHCKNYEPSEK